MICEWKQTSTVRENGKVEVTVPELHAGQLVEVSVRSIEPSPSSAERPLGLLKGKVRMSSDFDAPLDEFTDYT